MKQKLHIVAVLAALVAALLVSGCQQSPGAVGEPQLLTEEYDNSRQDSIYSEGNFIVANVKFDTPTPCYGMTASARQEGSKVIFVADIHSTLEEGQGCVQMIGSVSSKLKYGPMPKGDYTVEMNADYTNSGWDSATLGPLSVRIV